MRSKLNVRRLIVDKNGIPLRGATGMSYPLHISSITGNLIALEQYVALGVDINCRDKQGRTALHEACCIRNVDVGLQVVQFLVANGANVMATDCLGETPLHCVARHRRNRSVASFLVLDCNAPLNWLNEFGQTPLDVAKESSYSLLQSLDIKPEKLTVKSEHFNFMPEVLQFLLLHYNPCSQSLRDLAKGRIMHQLNPYGNEKLDKLPLPKHLKCYLGGRPYTEWIKQQEVTRGTNPRLEDEMMTPTDGWKYCAVI